MVPVPGSRAIDNARVLIVDDHALSARAMLLMFRARGYECVAVATPDDAIASIESFRPHVIVLEWAFRDPRHRGLGCAARLRTRSCELGWPVSIVIASCADQPLEFCDREGVDRYFTKPVAPHVLRAAVRELAARRPDEVARTAARDEDPNPAASSTDEHHTRSAHLEV